jgi:hypothetical protein
MQTLAELEKQLHEKRRLRGWYSARRDRAMEHQLRDECYGLFLEIGRLKRALLV